MCCGRYASRAKQYAIQRRNIVQQAGIEDSLLCSTAAETAATTSTTTSSLETAAESSFSTLQTESSLFASPPPMLPVVHEDRCIAEAPDLGKQQSVRQHRYDTFQSEDYDFDQASAAKQQRSGFSTQALKALKRKPGPPR